LLSFVGFLNERRKLKKSKPEFHEKIRVLKRKSNRKLQAARKSQTILSLKIKQCFRALFCCDVQGKENQRESVSLCSCNDNCQGVNEYARCCMKFKSNTIRFMRPLCFFSLSFSLSQKRTNDCLVCFEVLVEETNEGGLEAVAD